MMIKEIAEEIGCILSTVSRRSQSKYDAYATSVYELRYFFLEAVQGPSGAESIIVTQAASVKKMIEDEDPSHPLTDEHNHRTPADEGIQ